MGTLREPSPVKLVVPMLASEATLLGLGEQALATEFGPVDLRSEDLAFIHTRYYEPEMGQNLTRRIVSFERLIDPANLPSIKLTTNAIEATFAHEGRRRLNLDPGYISGAKLVLATTKNHSHRIYLGRGIYAEVTLAYRDGGFQSWPWTYPDYAEGSYFPILRRIRERYLEQLREMTS
jgi:hypothetical protein